MWRLTFVILCDSRDSDSSQRANLGSWCTSRRKIREKTKRRGVWCIVQRTAAAGDAEGRRFFSFCRGGTHLSTYASHVARSEKTWHWETLNFFQRECKAQTSGLLAQLSPIHVSVCHFASLSPEKCQILTLKSTTSLWFKNLFATLCVAGIFAPWLCLS